MIFFPFKSHVLCVSIKCAGYLYLAGLGIDTWFTHVVRVRRSRRMVSIIRRLGPVEGGGEGNDRNNSGIEGRCSIKISQMDHAACFFSKIYMNFLCHWVFEH